MHLPGMNANNWVQPILLIRHQFLCSRGMGVLSRERLDLRLPMTKPNDQLEGKMSGTAFHATKKKHHAYFGRCTSYEQTIYYCARNFWGL